MSRALTKPARPPHILIIEDDPVTRATLGSYLDSHGYRVSEADSSEKAERILADSGADLLIVDINLSGKDGLEITREQRHLELTSRPRDN